MTGLPAGLAPVRVIRDRDAEQVVLCGAVKAPDLVVPQLARMGLSDSAFTEWRHQVVWHQVVWLWNAGRDVGPYAVWFRLEAGGHAAEFDGCPAAWLLELWELDPTGMGAVEAAGEVLRLEKRRAVARLALETYRDAVDGCRETEFYEGVLALG